MEFMSPEENKTNLQNTLITTTSETEMCVLKVGFTKRKWDLRISILKY